MRDMDFERKRQRSRSKLKGERFTSAWPNNPPAFYDLRYSVWAVNWRPSPAPWEVKP